MYSFCYFSKQLNENTKIQRKASKVLCQKKEALLKD